MQNAVLTTLLRVFWMIPENAPSLTQIDWKDENFSGKFWSLKWSPRRVKRSFDNPIEIYSRKNRIFFARALKLAQKYFQRKPLFKLFQWTVRMHFWQTWRYIFIRRQLFSVWKSESDKQNSTTFFQKMYNSRSSYGHDECSFDNPVDKHSTKSRRVFAQSPKKMGEKLKADTSQNIPFARWNAILTTQSKNFRTTVKTFRSMSEQENKSFSSECFSAQLVPMCNWKASSFYNPVEEFVTNCRWFSAQHLKTLSIFFYKMLLWTRRRQFWQPHQKNFRQKAENNSIEVRKKIKRGFFKKLIWPQLLSCDT